MKLKSFILTLILTTASALSQINVGNALNNLNARTTNLELRVGNQDVFNVTNKIRTFWDTRDSNIFMTFENGTASIWQVSGSVTNLIYTLATEARVSSISSNFNSYVATSPFLKPVTDSLILNAYSNSVYSLTTGVSGITLASPVVATNRENRFTLHVYKNSGNLTWFSPITWVYGEAPQWEQTNKTYLIKLESIDNGVSWRGWVEYIY